MSSQPSTELLRQVRDVDRRRRVVRVPLRMDHLLRRDGRGGERSVDRVQATRRLQSGDEPQPLVVRPGLQSLDERRDALGRDVLGRGLDPDLHLFGRREERPGPLQHEERRVALDERDGGGQSSSRHSAPRTSSCSRPKRWSSIAWVSSCASVIRSSGEGESDRDELQLARQRVVVADHLGPAVVLVRLPQVGAVRDHADRVPGQASPRVLLRGVRDVRVRDQVGPDLLLRDRLRDDRVRVVEPADALELPHDLRDHGRSRTLGGHVRPTLQIRIGDLAEAASGSGRGIGPASGRRHGLGGRRDLGTRGRSVRWRRRSTDPRPGAGRGQERDRSEGSGRSAPHERLGGRGSRRRRRSRRPRGRSMPTGVLSTGASPTMRPRARPRPPTGGRRRPRTG